VAQSEGEIGRGPSTTETAPDVGRDDDLPVGVNLAWRLRALILSGRLPAGDRLPGIRDLAVAAAVNVNTVRALYRRLEDEGLVVSQHGMGTFVAPNPAVSPALEQAAADATESARELGIDPRELARAIYSGTAPGAAEVAVRDPSAPLSDEEALDARRSLRGQIARLEAQLAAYPEDAARTGIAEASPAPLAGPAARIADLGELETVRDQLFDRLKRVRAEADRRGREEGAARERFNRIVDDPAAHKWESVSNEQMGDPGCTTYQARPAWGPVGALMNWWRVKVSSGCP
jgi:DNA-binding transcriptional regulator YhcF (GntR family)